MCGLTIAGKQARPLRGFLAVLQGDGEPRVDPSGQNAIRVIRVARVCGGDLDAPAPIIAQNFGSLNNMSNMLWCY